MARGFKCRPPPVDALTATFGDSAPSIPLYCRFESMTTESDSG